MGAFGFFLTGGPPSSSSRMAGSGRDAGDQHSAGSDRDASGDTQSTDNSRDAGGPHSADRKDTHKERDAGEDKEKKQMHKAIYYGEEEEVELINWEEEFKKHLEETKRMNSEREEKIERAAKMEKSWELLRECSNFLRDNEKKWLIDGETTKQKTKAENKARRLELARIQKEETAQKLRQKRINETWNRLPECEKRHLMKQEEKRRLLELRQLKVNIWRKWRRKGEELNKPKEKTQTEREEIWLEKLEETVERMRKESEKRKSAIEEQELMRRNLLEQRKTKQEKILRENQEKRDRLIVKKMLEERWEMARWVSSYIEENSEKWNDGRNKIIRDECTSPR